MNPYFVKVSKKNWADWHWHLSHRITTVEELSKIIEITPKEAEKIKKVSKKFRWAISPYYASLMDPKDKNCPIRKQAIPSIQELEDKNSFC